jgi:hypothetical protein
MRILKYVNRESMFVRGRRRHIFWGKAIDAPIGSDSRLTDDFVISLLSYKQETWELEEVIDFDCVAKFFRESCHYVL